MFTINYDWTIGARKLILFHPRNLNWWWKHYKQQFTISMYENIPTSYSMLNLTFLNRFCRTSLYCFWNSSSDKCITGRNCLTVERKTRCAIWYIYYLFYIFLYFYISYFFIFLCIFINEQFHKKNDRQHFTKDLILQI